MRTLRTVSYTHLDVYKRQVLGVVSKALTFREAREKVYSAIEKINFSGIQYRRDIALKAEGSE